MFYVVDVVSYCECGVVFILLVCVLFYDYLWNLCNFSVELKDFVEIIEWGIYCFECIGKVFVLFGVVDFVDGILLLLFVGFDC